MQRQQEYVRSLKWKASVEGHVKPQNEEMGMSCPKVKKEICSGMCFPQCEQWHVLWE
eukprot:Gb_13583 [translate_table: standard]